MKTNKFLELLKDLGEQGIDLTIYLWYMVILPILVLLSTLFHLAFLSVIVLGFVTPEMMLEAPGTKFVMMLGVLPWMAALRSLYVILRGKIRGKGDKIISYPLIAATIISLFGIFAPYFVVIFLVLIMNTVAYVFWSITIMAKK